ncbi:MAG TPA: LysM peptidoglycan-binding domain-containing protein, partial [Anaerolineales bacterium]|nr:LysM peptidoglycan-binding domain-containing protein [Anaerolineales bacterium]
PGDTLYRIARRYSVSVDALQRANCRSTTVIYVGEHLWVPYSQPAATALTIIPTFPTPTEPAATASADP